MNETLVVFGKTFSGVKGIKAYDDNGDPVIFNTFGTLLATQSLGTVSTTSTSAVSTGVTVNVSGIDDYDALNVAAIINEMPTKGLIYSSTWIWLTASADILTKDGFTTSSAHLNARKATAGEITSRASTTAYGIYPSGTAVSGGSISLPMVAKYHSNQTGTIDGVYITRVYGIKMLDLIGS